MANANPFVWGCELGDFSCRFGSAVNDDSGRDGWRTSVNEAVVLSAREPLEKSLPELRAEVKPLVLRAIGADGRCCDLLSFVLKSTTIVVAMGGEQA